MQHIAETSKGKIIFVSVPEDAKDIELFKPETIRYWMNGKDYLFYLIDGNFHPIGFLKDVSEEQAIGMVDGGFCSTNGKKLFEHYCKEYDCFDAALESLRSLASSVGANVDTTFILFEKKN